MTNPGENLGCRGGMVAPWRNALAKSKQKHNPPCLSLSHDKSKKSIFLGVGVASWINALDKSKQKTDFQHYWQIQKLKNLGCRSGMVASWNTLANSKHISIGLSLFPTLQTDKKIKILGCREGMVAPWKNTLAKSKQKTGSSRTITLFPTQMTAPVKKRFFGG